MGVQGFGNTMASGFGMSQTATSGFGSVSNSSSTMLRPSSALMNKSIRGGGPCGEADHQALSNPAIMTEGAEDRDANDDDDDDEERRRE